MARRRRRPGRPRARRLVWPLLPAVMLVGFLFVGVYPTQTYFRQQEELDDKQIELSRLQEANAELEARADGLRSPEAVELLAREHYGLVFPGEEAYAIVPPEEEPLQLPDTWPFTELQVRLNRHLD